MRLVLCLSILFSLVSSSSFADELPAGFRWGVSAEPGMLIVTSPTRSVDDDKNGSTRNVAGGISFPVRLGYQFERSGPIGFSLYAEPRLGIYSHSEDGSTVNVLLPSGSAVAEVDIGKHFFIAAGLSLGGPVSLIGSQHARGPFMGGFTLRAGAIIPVHALSRPSAVTVSLDAEALFGSANRLYTDGTPVDDNSTGTAGMATLGISVGFDAF